MNFSIIVATNNNNGIGRNGDLLYRSKKDMNYFKTITTTVKNSNKMNVVIMGRKTWESIPKKYKPLDNRINIIISKKNKENLNIAEYNNVYIFDSFNTALSELKNNDKIENVFIIGGQQLYNEAILSKYCQYIYQTVINDNSEADTFFPKINKNTFELINEETIIEKECIRNIDLQKIDLNLSFKLYKSLIRYTT